MMGSGAVTRRAQIRLQQRVAVRGLSFESSVCWREQGLRSEYTLSAESVQ
jgi:hypothetical protein